VIAREREEGSKRMEDDVEECEEEEEEEEEREDGVGRVNLEASRRTIREEIGEKEFDQKNVMKRKRVDFDFGGTRNKVLGWNLG
jgi:hypothetical protein